MIDVINLEKNFGDKNVLDGISTTINKGDIVCVIGPSGSGKSTFLRCLNCMEDPTGGQIIFNGVDIADLKVDINIHRRKMGMVFQHFNLFNNKTVIENIMLAPVHIQTQELNKAKRKNLAAINMDDVLAIAPKGDRSVYKYENDHTLKYKNLTSEDATAKVYELVFKGEKDMCRWEFEPDEEMLNAIRVKYPHTVVK